MMESQMTCYPSLLQKVFQSIAVLAPMLIFVAYFGFEYSSILLTSTVVIISTMTFAFLKTKQVHLVQEKSHEKQDAFSSAQESSFLKDVSFSPLLQPESSTLSVKKDFQDNETSAENEKLQQLEEYHILDYTTESEGIDPISTSEESELEWPFQVTKSSQDFSDGSISDEESLIEIALPSGQCQCVGGYHRKESICNQQQNVLDIFPQKSMLQPQQITLMDLLAEINDMYGEDNLIEIDISMGSIMSPRYEIEA